MVEKQVNDLMVFVGNFDSSELGSFKICAVVDNPILKNQMMLLKCCARDVFVRRSGALAFLNVLLGRPNVVGRLDLDRVLTVAVSEGLVFDIKPVGKPNVRLVLPDGFDDLPESFKAHPFFGDALRIAYLAMRNQVALREMREEQGYSVDEIVDMQNQSVTKYVERMREVQESLSQEVPRVKPEIVRKPVDDFSGQNY